MKRLFLWIIYIGLVGASPGWGNTAPIDLLCRAALIHSANRVIQPDLRFSAKLNQSYLYELKTPAGNANLYRAFAAPPMEYDPHPDVVFSGYFLPDVDRARNWILYSPDYPWFQSFNSGSNCYAFASASRVAIPPDSWLSADEYRSAGLECGVNVVLRSYFVEVAAGPLVDAQRVLMKRGAREGDLVVFGRQYAQYFIKEHAGLLFRYDDEWALLHKIGTGPVVLTPLDDVPNRYGTNVRDFRVYRGEKDAVEKRIH